MTDQRAWGDALVAARLLADAADRDAPANEGRPKCEGPSPAGPAMFAATRPTASPYLDPHGGLVGSVGRRES